MAKARTSSDMTCRCNPLLSLIALVLLSLGIFGLVNGFALHLQAASAGIQMETMPMIGILVWYFGGMLLMLVGKMLKWKAHGVCPVHGKS